jgi:hypothetical protein
MDGSRYDFRVVLGRSWSSSCVADPPAAWKYDADAFLSPWNPR